ncbi:MAG: PIN domain-containing protein [Nitrospirae bacterium]|nr:PIN domain-containing protein [Nitrospirota bacterium]PIQ93035.1 MAG: VapC toxin family PIN domain ribonuclease [Nitrospirae bacterium CG11_big_fil_rev_8_21_14_0_20_41_14]PIV42054.1 MAG: PIN domain nuclease [Nitrospirae bacterium CG02_land_8_20_14_3_00_41_53]PIW87597.1 MAG: PIN domain nuclease [Nitrospirae bacterium CG_4_8_14_3_um_filter_41_47]
MTEDGVLVDTSVLIEFLKGNEQYGEEITKLLDENRVFFTGVIIAELLQGLKNMKEKQYLTELITAVNVLEITTDLWIDTGNLSLSLRRKGINLSLTDVAIASLAIKHNLQIFTLDKHFEQILGVKIYKM